MSQIQTISGEIADLVSEASHAVLQVDARRRLPATGIAWAEDLIVTAHHVVESEDDIRIGTADGAQIGATLLGRDPHNDLALLRVDGALAQANWAANDGLQIGNLALALGRPGQNIKATAGIVSGLVGAADIQRGHDKLRVRMQMGPRGKGHGRRRRRQRAFAREWGGALAGGFIQTDVTMYPGFSGGPLIGADGAVHGMNTSGFMRGISVAIPVSSIRQSVSALLEDGSIQRGYLGIGVQEARLPDSVAEALDQESGLLIVSVEADSPASAAGLIVGDILTALDGQSIEHVDELQLLLTRLEVDSEAQTGFVRGGAPQEGKVVIGAK